MDPESPTSLRPGPSLLRLALLHMVWAVIRLVQIRDSITHCLKNGISFRALSIADRLVENEGAYPNPSKSSCRLLA